MKKISIILSAYNDEKTVRQCLESIIAQENADMQIECIIVDDCSNDETLAIIRRTVGTYIGQISFRIYRHQTHHGLSRTRNTGLARSQGDYVMFVSAADTLRSGCIDEYMVNLMRHWDADIIAGNVYNVGAGRNLFNSLSSALALRGKGDVLRHEMMHNHLYLYAYNKLIRRELLDSNQIVFDETMAYADIQWAFTLFSCASSVILLPEVTYEFSDRRMRVISQKEKWANAVLGSYAATCDNLLNKAPRPEGSDGNYYLAHQLFIYGVLTNADNVLKEFTINSQVKRELNCVRSRLLTQTRNDGQKMLSLFFREDGSLLSGFINVPIFKHYRRVVEEMSVMLDIIVGR